VIRFLRTVTSNTLKYSATSGSFQSGSFSTGEGAGLSKVVVQAV
jgi:hypothetical protein